MDYLIGDLQGCAGALDRLLDTLGFSPSRDHLHALGDLVNRGPDSLAVLRRLSGLGAAATCLLGNHDLHLLAVWAGVRPLHRSDTLDGILQAPDAPAWIDWLRRQRLAAQAQGWLLVHAGVPPGWTAADTLARAGEVEALLQGETLTDFLPRMYGNEPAQWHDVLEGADRWRFIINALTRLRFCTPEGRLDFHAKEGADRPPPGCLPWFEVPGRRTADTPVAFGHWSTLGLLVRERLLGIDTGCVWGGRLTAVRIDGGRRDVIQVDCPQAQKPG